MHSPDSRPTADADASSRRLASRRSILAAAGTTALAASAGCLDGILSAGTARQAIEPEEPSEPRAGTPGEFYALLERNDVVVSSLHESEGALELVYRSNADDEAASNEEIATIVTVYNENLVKNGAGIETLYAEVANPFAEQAHGWGVQTEWLEALNAGETDEVSFWSNVVSSKVYADDVAE